MTTRTRRLAALLLIGTLLLLSACSADDAGDGGDDAGGGGGGTQADALEASAGSEGDAAPAPGESAAGDAEGRAGVDLTVAAEDRQIISTASVALTVDELTPAVDRVEILIEEAGGLIFAEDTDLRSGALTHLTVKVPPEAFRDTLRALAELGEVATQTISTDDVTDQVVDLDSRITTAEASVARLRLLLDRAERIDDITTIEGQLLARETDLETLRGQRRTIERQVALATIDITLSAERTSPPPPEEDEEPQTGFTDGLRGGADALQTFAVGASAVVGALLPWSPLLLLGAFVLWRTTRRKPTVTG
jgi:hypothetical protein